MQTIPVSSSLIAGATYDATTGELAVTFKSGQRWVYSGFSQDDADSFASASSAGQHFLSEIKNNFAARRA